MLVDRLDILIMIREKNRDLWSPLNLLLKVTVTQIFFVDLHLPGPTPQTWNKMNNVGRRSPQWDRRGEWKSIGKDVHVAERRQKRNQARFERSFLCETCNRISFFMICYFELSINYLLNTKELIEKLRKKNIINLNLLENNICVSLFSYISEYQLADFLL